METQLSGMRIAGVALLLFSGVLLGVGIHHLLANGTCSSTGYAANLGPVPHCPSGEGWWFAFVFVGIIGCLAGAAMAGSGALLCAGIFGAIGVGALTLVFDSHAASGSHVFGAAFGGVFALVGIVAAVVLLRGTVAALRPGEMRYGKTKTAARGPGRPAPAVAASSMGMPAPARAGPRAAAAPTPLGLVPGLQAVRGAATDRAVDELSKLADLHQRGSLTDEEFANAKAKLLGQL